jgi:hypothetical protein
MLWGLKNLLHTLVPKEKLELSGEDSKHRKPRITMFLQKLLYVKFNVDADGIRKC